MLVLALESSTTSAKAMLFDSEAGVIRTASCAYPQSISKDGITDTEQVYRLTMEMGRKVAAGKDIAAVALSCVWHSAAVCDDKLNSLGKTFSWNYLAPKQMCSDTRSDNVLSERLYRSTGCMPHVTYVRETLRYLRENGLDLKNKRFPSQGGYNFYRMTGDFLETLNLLSGTGLINVSALDFDDFAMEYAGVHPGQFGSKSTYTDVRPLNTEAANLLGIAPGIPMVPAHADGALNQIANCAGVVGRMTFSVGTSGAIRMTTKKPVLPQGHQLWSYFGVTDWISGAAVSGACNCIDWFKDTVLHGAMSYAELDSAFVLSEDIPVFLPFLFGERNPGWGDDRTGGFMGLKPEHSAQQLYGAVQMGVLFNIYQCYEALKQEVGVPNEICLSGGILHSKKWTQMAADVFGTRLYCVQNPNASCTGAAVLALKAADVSTDVLNYTHDIENAVEITPCSLYAGRYQELYHRYLYYYKLTDKQ